MSDQDAEKELGPPNSTNDDAADEPVSPTESPRDKKTRLSTTDTETSVPVSRERPMSVQDLLVAGINHLTYKERLR